MKYFVLFVVLAIAYLWWRHGRLGAGKDSARPPQPAAPQDMVRCAVCAVHLPRSEAVADAQGIAYCSQEHRLSGNAPGPR